MKNPMFYIAWCVHILVFSTLFFILWHAPNLTDEQPAKLIGVLDLTTYGHLALFYIATVIYDYLNND
jgi:hypothetical protein